MKILFLCALVGLAVAQRGSYGGSRPISGSRYGENSVAPVAAPAQSNFAAPSQGAPSNQDNRFNENSGPVHNQEPLHNQRPIYNQQQPIYNQQQPGLGGFGGFGSGFPNNQNFQPYPFNG